MNPVHSAMMIGVIALVTILLRAVPFWIFGGGRKTPDIIIYLGRVLPYAIMGMLVVYCLKGESLTTFPFGLPELIASVTVVLLQLWKRNTLISVGVGTVCYMLLVQLVFK